ncbi:hypothetical protein GCM10009104_08420 [Marinobacterium maritimum]|uniref:Lipoprotein n=1 Tax=Marinobacterium maritimum TaxID=500162 RepID=A0ABN1I3H1_9GAMM
MKRTLALICLATFAANAHAGVKEKKALRAADEKVAAAATQMQTACGNGQLEVKIDWNAVDAMAEQNSEIIKSKGMRLEWVYTQLGDRTVSTMEALGKICADDTDYKGAIAEISIIQVQPKPKYDDYKSVFSLEGTTLSIDNGWYMTRSASDFRTRLLNLF